MAKKSSRPAQRKRATLGNDPFAELSDTPTDDERQDDEEARVGMPAGKAEPAKAARKPARAKASSAKKSSAGSAKSSAKSAGKKAAGSQPAKSSQMAEATPHADDSPAASSEVPAKQPSSEQGGASEKPAEDSSMSASNDVVLPEVVMLPNAGEVAEEIAHALAVGQTFSIDAGKVERVDTAGMQLLFAAIAQGRSQGLKISLINAGETVRAKAAILDLEQQLGL